MINRQVRSLVLVALAMIAVGLGLATDAEAQVVTYYYGDAVAYSSSVLHYHRVYQGSSWHWNPALGWHTHDHYIDVPHWVPTRYTYRPAPYLPVVTYYSR